MIEFKINDSVSWVGTIDSDVRRFHGEQLTTDYGTSYNAYLIRDEKNVIIDSVYKPFAKDFVANLEKTIGLDNIDIIVANHAEPDHSAGLAELLAVRPDLPVYCTANGAKSLKGYYHKDYNFITVKTGDRISIGSRELVFIEAPMCHWPDTMMTYLTGDDMLFSNDVFGQHYAAPEMYADTVPAEDLYYESIKYYANIVSPFSKKALKTVQEFIAMQLPTKMICPAHGVIWRDNLEGIINNYIAWANEYADDQVTVIYDTMYESSESMANAIAEGVKAEKPELTVKVYNSSVAEGSDIVTEVFRSKGVLVGSPTYNNGILTSIAAVMEEIKGIVPVNKKGSSFGSYGWSPANVKIINELLKGAGIEVIGAGMKVQWNPDEKALAACFEYGKEFAKAL